MVPIPAEAIPILKEYTKNCHTIQLFTKSNGSIMTLSSYVKFWQGIIKALNFALLTDEQKEK